MKKRTAAGLAAGGAALVTASGCYFHRQNTALTASHYGFRSPKVLGPLEGFRITQVSDLHNRSFGPENCRLVALIEAQLPDLLVITGDLIDSYHPNIPAALDTVRRLARIAPCYYVTGNHEHRMSMERQRDLYRQIQAAGVRVLRNQAISLREDVPIRLLGMDCDLARTDRLLKLMKDRPPEELNILLSHKPHFAKNYARSKVDLVLTGHAHGGQWRLPGIGGIYAPGQGLLPQYTAGMYRLGDDTVMCVSRGLGNSSFPLRIDNRPELVTVILRGQHTL